MPQELEGTETVAGLKFLLEKRKQSYQALLEAYTRATTSKERNYNYQLLLKSYQAEQRKLEEQKKEIRTLQSKLITLESYREYEKTCDKVQAKLKGCLEAWGAEIVIPGVSNHGEMLMLPQAIEQNLEKIKPAVENWLKQELATERETTQQALQTSQEWHERQKREITEAKDQTINQLQTKITQLNQQIINLQEALVEEEKHRQRNHEIAKQKDEIIKEKNQELKALTQEYQAYKKQKKQQLTQEIQLIKEALHD